MIEPIMYFGIGFLVAALLGLLFVPLVHNRAVRLTMRRLEAATPLSIAEIRADKDQLPRRIRHVDATPRNERRADEGENDHPARRTRQEDRRHQSAQERTRREDRGDFRARSARQDAARTTARHRGGVRAQDRAHCARPSARSPTRRPSSRSWSANSASGRSPPTTSASNSRVAHPGRGHEGQRRRVRAHGERGRGAACPRARRADAAKNSPRPAASSTSRRAQDRSRAAARGADRRSRSPQPTRPGAGSPARRTGPAHRRTRLRDRRLRSEAERPARRKPICATRVPNSGKRAARPTHSGRNRPARRRNLPPPIEERAKLQREMAR